jgi:hypothetical protein
MPKFSIRVYEQTQYIIEFTADSIEHAKELLDAQPMDETELPEGTKYWRKGSDDWDIATLKETEITNTKEGN